MDEINKKFVLLDLPDKTRIRLMKKGFNFFKLGLVNLNSLKIQL